MYKESPITITNGDIKIFGILSEPNRIKNTGITIVFLHGWAGYRIGPHRMFVNYARKLTESGYHCIRFDFRGKGFSPLLGSPSNQTMLSDINTLLEYIHNNKLPKQTVLIGICSGARLALYYAMKGMKPVDHVIELSTPLLRNEENLTVEINRSKSMVHAYFKKLLKKDTWNKLFEGKIRFHLIAKIILGPMRNSINLFFRKNKEITNTDIKRKSAPSRKDAFANFKGDILAIHGEKDPETEIALKQVKNLLTKNHINHDVHIIKDANHSFYSLEWEEKIFKIIRQWLNERYIQ